MAKRKRKGAQNLPEKRQSNWKDLDSVDWAIINILLKRPGITDPELGEEVGFSRYGINDRRNNPALQYELRELQMDVIEKIKGIQIKAARRLEKIIDTGEDAHAKTAAATIIDGLPEIAAGLARPHNDGDEPTEADIEALENHLAEIKKRKTADEGGAS